MTRVLARIAVILIVLWWLYFMITTIIPPAYAGDSVGSALWPPEPQYEVMVKEITCMQLQDCCDIWGPCWNGWDKPIPVTTAPVPLPPAGLMLTAAVGLLWRIR